VRFLHVVRRQLFDAAGEPVDELVVKGERQISWEEAVERERGPGAVSIDAGREEEPLDDDCKVARSWKRLEGSIDTSAEQRAPGLHRLSVRISNTTPFASGTREEALEQTFCSCHTVLRAGPGAEFVSLTDPQPDLRREAEACVNEGAWPVLAGEPPDRSTLLSSPIILEDYPRIAPESPGDLFDGGEIDQMLVLNILSLTDEEKAEMRASDPRAREILERTEGLTNEQLMALNGTIREMRYARP
jgi:hydrogenase maturation protease